jgi:hypothetical protein
MHMPVVMGFQMAFAPVTWSAVVKVPIVVVLSSAVLVWSYDLLVRPTGIGVLLNGRRYPRWFGSRQQRRLTRLPLRSAADQECA